MQVRVTCGPMLSSASEPGNKKSANAKRPDVQVEDYADALADFQGHNDADKYESGDDVQSLSKLAAALAQAVASN